MKAIPNIWITILLVGATRGVVCQTTAATPFRAPPAHDWQLVRSVPNPFGGTEDLVVVPERRKADLAYYRTIADIVCGSRPACMVKFWTDSAHVPKSGDMPVTDLSVMTASYERARSYKKPHLGLACWLYPSKEVGEAADCFYMPSAVMPWEKKKP
jgi:hypothetical protein